MALTEISTCTIKKLNSKAYGESSTEKGKVTLPYVLEGEVVEFERHYYRGKENFLLKNIISPSSERIIPECSFYERCGGCLLQHLSKEKYRNFKQSLLSKVSITPSDIITPKNPSRRRLNLFFKNTEKQLYFGFYKLKSDDLINTDSCIAATFQISEIIPHTRDFLSSISKINDSGEVFILEADNGIDIKIILDSAQSFDEKNRKKIRSLAGKYGIVRIIYIHNKQIISNHTISEPYVEFAEEKVFVEADCFLQATKDSDKLLSDLVISYLGNSKNKKVADLFCGRGTFTIGIAKNGFKVVGFENDKKAILALFEATKKLSNKPVLHIRDLHYNPLFEELEQCQIIVLNPPRAGAEEQVKNIVKLPNIEKIIYVSCSVQSFLRDAEILRKSFILKDLKVVDQFLWTPHIELVAEFIRIDLS